MKLDYTIAADALAIYYGLPPALLSALVNAESAWNPKAVSPTGATGLPQFIKSTGTLYGLVGPGFDNRTDAALSLTAMCMYLADLHKTQPTWRDCIVHYSGQDGNLSGYARYSAGRVLIATIDTLDKGMMPA